MLTKSFCASVQEAFKASSLFQLQLSSTPPLHIRHINTPIDIFPHPASLRLRNKKQL